MALYLNLYHEIQKQKLNRQRDPLKLAMLGLVVVAAGFVVYYFWRLESVKRSQQAASNVIADLKKYDPQAAEAQKHIDQYDAEIKLADAVIHRMESRFYWAPLLQQVIEAIPADVQVTGMDGAISSDGSRRVTLSFTGIAAGGQPRAVAEELRIGLQNKFASVYSQPTATFRSLDDGAEAVQYLGKSSPTVQFVIDVTFTSPDVDVAAKPAKSAKPAKGHKS